MIRRILAACLVVVGIADGRAEFSLIYTTVGADALTDQEASLLSSALEESRQLWESLIVGHQGQAVLDFDVEVRLTTTGLASARPDSLKNEAGYTFPTAGIIWMNRHEIVSATDGLGIAAGVDVLTELMAHETAHALGFGTLWGQNGLYDIGTGRYMGTHGLAAYQVEFDHLADWVPIELAGSAQSANAHWDQRFRSAAGEGNPLDPLSLSPLTGIVDQAGRDLGLELMTAALDPDYGAPFLSHTTIQSLRDLGYQVVPESSSAPGMLLGLVLIWMVGRRTQREAGSLPSGL